MHHWIESPFYGHTPVAKQHPVAGTSNTAESMLHKISQTLRDIHDTQLKIKLIQ